MIPAQEITALNAELSAAFGPGQVVARRVLQSSPRALVAEAADGAERVVVKQFHTNDPVTTIERLREEHAAIGPHLAQGPFRLAHWRRLDAPRGLAVLTHAPGQRMDGVLAEATAPERAGILGLVGGWLAAFARPRRHVAPFALHPVIRRRKEAAADLPLRPKDRTLTANTMAALRSIARALHGAPLEQTHVHADLAPYNLHLAVGSDGHPEVWAYDLQSARRRPLALDAATFLVTAGLRQPPAPGAPPGPLPDADRIALLAACPEAGGAALDFYTGDRLLHALHEASSPARATAARAALHGWLACR
jgi:aminoglycoside/choline kinase family phosphotransferase